MEQRPLRQFIAVAEEHCFSRAAQRLGITQPALSRQIRKLEEQLGVQLFRRTAIRVELTEAGQLFLEEVRRGLMQLEWATHVARRAGSGNVGHLTIGVVDPITYSVLPAIVRAFHEHSPEVKLDLNEMHTGQQMSALREERLHVGFLRPPAGCSDIAIETIMTEAVMVAVPRGHPLAGESRIFLGDLASEPLVLFRREMEPTLFDTYIQLCADAGFAPTIIHAADPTHLVVGLVAAGLGFTLLPASVRNLQRPDVVYRALQPPTPKIALAAAWRADDTSPVLQAFLDVVRDVTRSHRPESGDRRILSEHRATTSSV